MTEGSRDVEEIDFTIDFSTLESNAKKQVDDRDGGLFEFS